MIEVISHDIITTLRCDQCQKRLRNEVGTLWFANTKEAVAQAQAYGWKVEKGTHLCPQCKDKQP